MFQCNGKHGPRIPHHPTYFNIEYTNQLSHCIALKQKKERQKHTWAAAAYSKTLSRPPYFDGCLVAFSYYSSWYHFALVTTTKTSCPAAERTSTDRPTDGRTDWLDWLWLLRVQSPIQLLPCSLHTRCCSFFNGLNGLQSAVYSASGSHWGQSWRPQGSDQLFVYRISHMYQFLYILFFHILIFTRWNF